jgi:hypothetical protein
MEAQRLKTRGRNPNPTTQAQSKRCFTLSTKTQNIIENVQLWRQFWVPFSSLFHKSGPRGPGPHPKVPTRHQHGPQGYPNGAQGRRNEAPRSPQSAQKPTNCTPCVSRWKPKVSQWRAKATQSAKETPQGHAKWPKHQKNMNKPPAAGCSPKAT